MGYDTSFHPVDHWLLQDRLHPYLLGQTDDLDDLVTSAVRIAKVRFRANAWGLGALEASPPGSFRPHLHVWGRPFLVTGETTEAIAAGIDAYLVAAPGEEVDAIAREMLDALEPGFAARVIPSRAGRLPADAALAADIRERVDALRAAIAAIRAGRSEVHLEGRRLDPREVVGRETMALVLEFAAYFRPGWMSRGTSWPTRLLRGDARARFIPNAALVSPLSAFFALTSEVKG